jgi:D-arabinonate dehydratase/D-galactarolactone cycloisomerase
MKIQETKTIVLADRFVLVQVVTDEGIIGIGECSPMNATVTVPMVELLRDIIEGEDPRNIERLLEKMLIGSYKLQGRAAALAISGIEIALWDILGKSVSLPVYRLLGGCYRDKIRMYATLSRDTPKNLVRRAKAAVDHGFTGVKIKVATRWGFDAKPDPTVETIRAVREEIGPDVDIMVDANSGWTVPTAIRMCHALEPFNILHLEQPVPERDLDALASVNQATTIPITFGEEDWSLWRFREVLEKGAAEVLQADPIKAAGILGCKKVGILAEAYSKILTPHNTSVHVGMAATLHLVAAVPVSRNPIECLILPDDAESEGLEVSRTKDSKGASEVKRHLLTEPFKVEKGSIRIPERPGLGIELNPDIVRKHASAPVDLG